MKKTALLLLFTIIGLSGKLSAQLTGVKTIPIDYPTLDIAITDLNTQGVGAGGVIIQLLPGNPQTAPAGGYSITTLTGTAANPIVISGNNNTITASNALTVGALDDAIFKIIGSDFVGITGFTMQENPANTVTAPEANNNMTEWGVALLYTSTTDGAQDNAIYSNVISLDKNYRNTWGIYSNTRHSATNVLTVADITAAGGSNSRNTIISNAISNVNFGIAFIGSGTSAFMDQNNVIGGPGFGNTITNWGGQSALSAYVSNPGSSYCIFMNQQGALTVRGNTISTSVSPTVTLQGILQDYTVAAPSSGTINRICQNDISIVTAQTAGTFQAISVQGGNNSVLNFVDSNLVHNCAITGVGSVTTLVGIHVNTALGGLNVRYNRVLNNTSTATVGGFFGIVIAANMGGNFDINNNQIGNATNNAITFSAAQTGEACGICYVGIGSGGAGLGINDNTFHGFVFNVTASAVVNVIRHTGTVAFSFVNGNVFDNMSFNTTGTIKLINNDMAAPINGNASVSGNSIVGTCTKTVAGVNPMIMISATGASLAGATRVTQNNIFSGVSAIDSPLIGIQETGGAASNSINRSILSNTLSNWTTSANVNGIQIGAARTGSGVSGNTITNINTGAGLFIGLEFGTTCGGDEFCYTNTVTNITSSGAVELIRTGAATFTSLEIANNVLGAATSTSVVTSVFGITQNASGVIRIYGNTVYDLNSAAAATAGAIAIGGTFSGAASSVYGNKIYDIENTNSNGLSYGIYVFNCSTLDVYNNLIGDLRAPNSTNADAVTGINSGAGAASILNVYYNTVQLAGSSVGSGFGSSCFRTSTAGTVLLQNNLFVNGTVPTGAGRAVAFTRTTSSLATYDAASNNNSFYAGVPSASNLIFFDGTNSDQTLAQFQTRVGPARDANSVSENPVFSSTTGTDPDFLHIPAATATLLESGGTAVAGITTDWDADTRPGPVGSVNGGAIAPDIGADEFDGILATCSGTPTAGTASTTSPASQCEGSTFDLELNGHSTGIAFTYQWQESTVSGGPYSNVAGATSDTYTTVALSNTMYYVCVVTCTVSGLSATSTEVTCTINLNPVLSFAPASPSLCAGGAPVNVVVSGANTYVWSPATGLSSSTINNPDASPAATTTYTVTGTSVDGCIGTNTVTVTVNPAPTLVVSATPNPLCNGNSTTLSASGADTYIWEPMFISGSSITDAPATTTTYTVTGTDLNGCTNSETITVTVVPSPTVTASADFTTVCEGAPVQLTGSGATTYLWNPGAIAGSPVTVNPTANITYTVVGTDVNGCTGTDMVSITVIAAPSVSATATPATICAGDMTTLDGSGASSYTWMPGSLSGASVTDAPASTTTYTVTGTDGFGCTATATVLVTVNPLPTVTASATPASICDGDNSSLSASGANGYLWLPGFMVGTPVTVTPIATTTYTVIGTDVNGCSSQATTTVTVNSLPAVTASATPNTICEGSNVTLDGFGASTYSWMPGSLSGASVTDAPTATTTYTVTGTDVNGCTGTATAMVTVLAAPSVSATATPATICAGDMTTLDGFGASTYSWMPGSLSGSSVTDAPASTTTYTVTGTDGFGCTGTATVLVTVNPLPAVTASASPAAICDGDNSSISASGASSYLWMPGSMAGTPVTVTPIATTTYTVTGTDVNGCSSQATTTVTVNSLPAVTATATPNAICEGSNVTLDGFGASTYSWMPGSLSGASVTDAPATTTTYTVTGTDVNGCTGTATAMVTVNPAPTVGASASATTICEGSFTMLTGSGATTYDWMPGSLSGSSVIVSPATTTTYTVTGTDGNGCTSTATITITVNPNPVVTISGAGYYCQGGGTTLTASAGSTWSWYLNGVQIPLANAQTHVANAPGIYNVMVSLPTGCADSAATGHTLTESPAPTVSFTAMPSLAVCAGSSITLSGSGAVTYSWSGGIFDATPFTPAVSGDYTVTGTDALGCTNTAVASVTVIPVSTVSFVATPGTSVCAETVVTLSGTGASTYTWSGGITDGLPFTASSTNTYTVTGTDVNGCTDTETVTITVNPTPTITITASPGTTVCQGTAVTLSGSGATTYSWSGGVTDGVPFTPATTTTYTVTGTDVNGCQSSETVTITVNPVPTVGYTAAPGTTICAGESVTLNGTGTTSYSWSGGIFNGVPFTPAATTTYTVTGTNIAGCTGTATVTITVNPVPTVGTSATPSATVCAGNALTLNGTGATSYTWSGGVTDGVSFVPPATATYTVTGTDVNGCTNTATILVTVNPLPTVGATASPGTSVCTGSSVTLNGTGATSYTWSGGVTDGVAFVPPSTTSYVVTGTDASGCANTSTITITVNPLPTVGSSVSPASTVCAGTMVTLSGTGAVSYAWSGGVTDGVPFAAASTQTYTVTGTDGNGCTNTSTTTITVNPAPAVVANASPSTSVCTGSSVTLTGSGATTYTWSGGVTDGVAFVPPFTNTYTVTGSDAIGCTNTATITIVVNPQPGISSTASPGTTVCAGSSVTLNGTGGVSYTWSGGVTDGVAFTPASTTTYTVTGTDGNGCTNTATTTITVNPAPTITAGASPSTAVCEGTMVTLNGFGGSSYSWSGGVTDGVPFAATATTTYTVVGTDGNGCTGTTTITINVNLAPNISAVQSPAGPHCAGSTVTLNGIGGISYTWCCGVTDGVGFVPAATATYTVTGSDFGGCTSTATVTVVVNPLPTVSSTASPGTTVCSGTPVTLNGTGASTYTWSGGVTNGVPFTAVSTNTYTVTGTDASGCTGTATTTITVNPTPTVSSTTSPASAVCVGTAVTLSGTGAVSYTWTGGVTNGVPFTPVSTASYTVTGTAANGCTSTAVTVVTVNPLPTVGSNTSPSPLVCSGTQVTLSGTGATTYVWTGGVTDNVPFTAVSSNSYTVTGTDGNGCTNTATTTVTVNTSPTVGYSASPGISVCTGTEITLDGTGATTYAWSDGIIDGNPFTPLATDTVTVIGTDGNGCEDTATVIITVDTIPVVTTAFSPNDTVCENAQLTLMGVGAATYVWSHGVTDNVAFAATTSTTYTVIGTDGNGCSDTTTQDITVIAAPVVSIGGNSTFCAGGSTVLSSSAGTTYQWFMNGSPISGETASTYTATAAGVYNVWVVNASGCGDSSAVGVNVTINALPTVAANATATTICSGASVTLTGSGAVSYAWSGGVNNGVPFSPLSTLTYTVVGTASNGCTDDDTITVIVNALPIVSTSGFPAYVVCENTAVTLNGNGAATYTWTGGVLDGVPFTPTVTDTYTVTGTDLNGCSNTETVTVTVNALPVVDLGPDSTQCGSIMLDAGNAGSAYAWSTSATTQTITATVSGTYVVDVTNGAGCTASDTVVLTINTQPVVMLGADDTLCASSVTLDAMNVGGNYLWNDMSTGQTNVATTSGTYFVEVTMPGGCVASDTINLVLNTPPNVTLTLPIDTACLNMGAVMLSGESPAGGTWSGPAVSGNSFDPMIAGIGTFGITYTYTDTNGCTGSVVDSMLVDPCLAVVEPIATVDFSMYPNPNNGEFSITVNGNETVQVLIYNGAGQIIIDQQVNGGEITPVSLEASGIYMVTVITNDGQQLTKRVIVNR